MALAEPDETFFCATHARAELDMLLLKGNKRIGIEIKRGDAPGLAPSMRIAMNDLGLYKQFIIYTESKRYSLGRNMEVLHASGLSDMMK